MSLWLERRRHRSLTSISKKVHWHPPTPATLSQPPRTLDDAKLHDPNFSPNISMFIALLHLFPPSSRFHSEDAPLRFMHILRRIFTLYQCFSLCAVCTNGWVVSPQHVTIVLLQEAISLCSCEWKWSAFYAGNFSNAKNRVWHDSFCSKFIMCTPIEDRSIKNGECKATAAPSFFPSGP